MRCPKCKHIFAPAAAPLPVPEPAAPAAPAAPVAPAPEPVAIPVPAAPAALDDNPFALPPDLPAGRDDDFGAGQPHGRAVTRAQRAGAGKSTALIAGGAAFGLLVLVGGVVAVVFAMKAPPKPTELVADVQPKQEPPKPKPKPPEPEPETTPDGRMTDRTLERVKASTVYIRTFYADETASSGSGFFAAAPGLVVTNAHVVGQSSRGVREVESVEVVVRSGLPDEQTFPARVLKTDPRLDLALLKVADIETPTLEVADAFYLKETQPVYIFGFPGGENLGTNISVNTSTISSLRRDEVVPWIQVAGGMHPGNSGGPVTDAAGRVIGVARAVIVGTQINMAIPGDVVHSFFHNAGDLIPKQPEK